MKVLVACEFSGRVRDAFLLQGHDAISCDILPSERPGPHYQGDVKDILSEKWNLLIAHPPCTYLSCAGNAWLTKPGRIEKRTEAFNFFMTLVRSPIPKIAIENPVGYLNTAYRKPDQIIQPWYFGEPEMKTTCLWLKGLPKLQPTKILSKPSPKWVRSNGKGVYFVDSMPKGPDRAKNRSRTFQGIANAMADQWGDLQHSRIQSSLLSFLPGGL